MTYIWKCECGAANMLPKHLECRKCGEPMPEHEIEKFNELQKPPRPVTYPPMPISPFTWAGDPIPCRWDLNPTYHTYDTGLRTYT